MNKRDQIRRKAEKSRSQQTWNLYKRQKNKCTNMIRRAKAQYNRKLELLAILDEKIKLKQQS